MVASGQVGALVSQDRLQMTAIEAAHRSRAQHNPAAPGQAVNGGVLIVNHPHTRGAWAGDHGQHVIVECPAARASQRLAYAPGDPALHTCRNAG